MTGSPRLTTTAPCTPTLQRTFPTQALGWGGRSPAWRPEVGQSRHEVKRQRSNKRPASPPGGDDKSPHHRNLPHGHPQESCLAALRRHWPRAHAGSCSQGHVRTQAELLTGPCSPTPPPSLSSQPPSVAARAPGARGAAPTPAPHGWRARRSGPDLQGGRGRGRAERRGPGVSCKCWGQLMRGSPGAAS